MGVVATQSFTNKSFGLRGLALLKSGKSAQQALDELLAADDAREVRQVAILDNQGRVATHTGKKCVDMAGHQQGAQFSGASQYDAERHRVGRHGQSLRSQRCPTPGRARAGGPRRRAGGGRDIQGRQSAALLVVRGTATEGPWPTASWICAWDDAAQPLGELRRLLKLHRATTT